ncbi:MAG: HEAT repeat domain-containing protein [Candidatus Zixiibacteriota bacterium]
MDKKSLENALEKIARPDKDKIMQGLKEIEPDILNMKEGELKEAIFAVSSLFYIDPLEHPDLQEVVDKAIQIIASLKEKSFPYLLPMMLDSDFKKDFNIAQTFGLIGEEAIPALLDAFKKSKDQSQRIFILYALGKIRNPKVKMALPVLIEALGDENIEIRDSAARTIGKTMEIIPPDQLTKDEKSEIFENLVEKLSDEGAGVRSKAIRSLGKMARFNHLDEEQIKRLKVIVDRTLGIDESYQWDRAYIVRKEAQQISDFLEGK